MAAKSLATVLVHSVKQGVYGEPWRVTENVNSMSQQYPIALTALDRDILVSFEQYSIAIARLGALNIEI